MVKLFFLQGAAVLAAWLFAYWLYPLLTAVLGVHAGALLYIPVAVTALCWGPQRSVAVYIVGVVGLGLIYGLPADLFKPVFLLHLGFALVLSALLAAFFAEARARTQQQVKLELLTQRLEYFEQHDPLTGLFNRDAFQTEFTRRTEVAPTTLLALCLIDLDDFKALNDTYGQTVGDVLLKRVAQRLGEVPVPTAVLARLAGDEFVLFAPLARLSQARNLAADLLDTFREPFLLDKESFFIKASVGVSFFPRDGDTLDALLRTADSAVYRAKRRGKGGFDYHPPPQDGLSERFDVEYKLRDAVECGELEVYYQPQVNVAHGKLIGLEALVRWHHPELGFLAPDRFISVAEHTGLIIPIGAWVLEAACRQQRLWQEASYAPGRIAVNVSAVQFSHPDFLENVVETLKDARLDPGSLELEITEGALINNMAAANKTLYALRDLGVTLAIDDFGTGYSSLAYLQTMPVNTLKIDRSFMPPVGSKTPLPKEETQLIRGIIGLAHGLEKTVIAEGVENEIHLEFLRQVGCEYAQGYYFGKPLDARDVGDVLKAFKTTVTRLPAAPRVQSP